MANADLPVGTIIAWAGEPTSPPSGWLFCDGTSYPTSNYPQLQQVIGTNFGNSSSSTNFNVPDLRGYFLRDVGNGGGVDPDQNRAVGSTQDQDILEHQHEYQLAISSSLVTEFDDDSDLGIGYDNLKTTGLYNGAGNDTISGEETRPVNVAITYLIKAE
jgi:microcystin-dependent protein